METLKDKLDADARFEANPPKPPIITDPTKLFSAFGEVYESYPDDEQFSNMPRCTTDALHELLHDDDPGEDIQFRAMYRKAADAIEALAKALDFARKRLDGGSEVDRAVIRGIDKLLKDAGLELSVAKPSAADYQAIAAGGIK